MPDNFKNFIAGEWVAPRTGAYFENRNPADWNDVIGCFPRSGPEDVARPKPSPDMLLAALSHLRLSAQQALYIGDMVVDIETARAAGLPVWVVATGSDEPGTLDRARPDRRLRDLGELAELLG